jgi:hypothetical protein
MSADMSAVAKGAIFEKERKTLHQDGKWTCPSCKKVHTLPHWKDHHQVDDEFKNKTYCDGLSCKESGEYDELDETGTPKPLFCPCCSWEEERVVFVKTEPGQVIYA